MAKEKKAKKTKELAGWTQGAKILDVKKKAPMIRVLSDLVYAQRIGARAAQQLRLTVLVPETPEPKPAVLFFPGGGWLQAAKDRFAENRWALAQAGFVIASAEYRTIPTGFPAQLADGRAAVRFLRAHASELSIDPGRIGVMGNSAGGWLALMVALAPKKSDCDTADWAGFSSQVQAACALHPVTSLLGIAEGLGDDSAAAHASAASPEALLLNGMTFSGSPSSIDADPARALAASPAGLVKRFRKGALKIPFLLMAGSSDRVVSPRQSASLFEALKAKGADAKYFLLKGVDHSGDPAWYQKAVCEKVNVFFEKTLGKKG